MMIAGVMDLHLVSIVVENAIFLEIVHLGLQDQGLAPDHAFLRAVVLDLTRLVLFHLLHHHLQFDLVSVEGIFYLLNTLTFKII